jgi:hypothetical protein
MWNFRIYRGGGGYSPRRKLTNWNPINKGDSGGPVLISKKGEWIVYGVNSEMAKQASNHANPLHNPGLYQTVISSDAYKKLGAERNSKD